MSSDIPPRRHRHTRSAAIPASAASSQNPQNPHHLNVQAHAQNNQSKTNINTVSAAHPTTPPRTPRRQNQAAPQNTANSSAPENGSKQKSRNKNRPKNVMTSPAATRKDRKTPPQNGPLSAGMPSARPMNTPSTAAYAGSTFHASPAPSALPIPSFYSKSVPESPGLRGLRGLKDNSSASHLATPPSVKTPAKKFQREESPLDIFFNADRAEKERARSAISYQSAANGPFQPPAGSPRSSQTPPASRSQTRSQTNQSKRISGSGMFVMEELDGEENTATPFGPAFSTPYSERINAARSAKQSTQFSTPPSNLSQQSHSQNTDALKAYLFSDPSPLSPTGTTSTAGSSYQSQYTSHGGPKSAGLPPRPQYNNTIFNSESRLANVPRTSARSSGLRQEVTPTKTPTRTPDRNNAYGQPNSSLRPSRGVSSEVSDFDLIFGSFKNAPGPASSQEISSGDSVTDLQGATDALRKILKLDSQDDDSNGGIANMPQATTSVPNYVGGRPPPMNGMHNGVMGS